MPTVIIFKSAEPFVYVTLAADKTGCSQICRMIAGKLSFTDEIKYLSSDLSNKHSFIQLQLSNLNVNLALQTYVVYAEVEVLETDKRAKFTLNGEW